jgi:ribonucleoside-diphosphate reductase alpha chain
VYVTGSREKVVLETRATASGTATVDVKTNEDIPGATGLEDAEQLVMWQEDKKPRPRKLPGYTFSINTPLGKAFVTINENGGQQPFEVFVNTAKAGSDTAAVSEAIGRLVSYILRLSSPVSPRERLREVWRQLAGIGGGRSLGFGPNRVRSLPDGVAQALSEYLEVRPGESVAETEEHANNGHRSMHATVEPNAEQPFLRVGDLCPECGQAAVVNEEGCRKCYACGYSEC